jgi:hypothetical protein
MSLKNRLRRLAYEIEGGETLTFGQVFGLLQAVTDVIKRHVTDPAIRRAIADDIRRLRPRTKVETVNMSDRRCTAAHPNKDDL